MQLTTVTFRKSCIAFMALLGWLALLLQFLLISRRQGTVEASHSNVIVNYFCYFTILTNLVVATSLTTSMLLPQTKAGRFFKDPVTRSAVRVYIAIVALVYSMVLRNLWNPAGWQRLADMLQHDVIPVIIPSQLDHFCRTSNLKWRHPLLWLIYPAFCLALTLAGGAQTNWYPYPFINASEPCYRKVLDNIIVLFAAFSFTGLLVVFTDRLVTGISGRKSPR